MSAERLAALYESLEDVRATQDGQALWLLTGEDFGIGESPYEAEDNRVDRPDWLTNDVMRKIVDEANVKLMLAPW